MIASQTLTGSIPTLLQSHRLHFIGIGGSGMAPLAEIAALSGYTVSGSDAKESTVLNLLRKHNIAIYVGHNPNALEALRISKVDAVIYSSAIAQNHPEWLAAKSLGIPFLHRSDLLHFFLEQKAQAVTIAGTNGKSTTTSMVAFLLHKMGKSPLAIVGAQMKDCSSLVYPVNNENTYAVAEADESDGTFLKFRPYVGVLTSAELDHLDFYRNHEHILQTFQKYLHNIQDHGTAVLGIDNTNCAFIAKNYTRKKLSYGFSQDADLQAYDYQCTNGHIYFSMNFRGQKVKCHFRSVGQHNASNALASLASIAALDLNLQDASEALSQFSGVKRRLDLIFEDSNLKIYDDYAHNPTKIQAVLRAVRESWLSAQIIVIFQPHRYSRLKTLYNNFVGSFSDASLVIALPTYGSGEQDETPIPHEQLVHDICNASKVSCVFADNFDNAENTVVKNMKKNAIILTLGAGDIWQLAFQLKERLG